MTLTSLEYELTFEKAAEKKAYPVIIVAAGSASRMQGMDKLSLEIAGLPVLARTVLAFDKSDRISQIILVTREDKISEYTAFKDKFNITKEYSVVVGGASREESVFCGIKALGDANKVLVHDGARPIVSGEVIGRVADALSTNDSVTCGVKIVDTVKQVNEDNFVTKTLNRDFLYSVQTPQGVSVDSFNACAAEFPLSRFTDDTSVVEAVGCKTVIVEGDRRNIKITTPADIKLAESYLTEENL